MWGYFHNSVTSMLCEHTVNHSAFRQLWTVCWIQFPILISAVFFLNALEIYWGSHHRTVSFELWVSVTQHTDSQINESVINRGGGMSWGKQRPLDIFIFLLWAFWPSFPRQSCAVKEGQRWELPSRSLSHRGHCVPGDPRVRPWMLLL